MTSLEELTLRLHVVNRSVPMDSNYLNHQLLRCMPNLHTFNCDIRTHNSSSNEVVQQPLKESQYLFYNGRSHPAVYYSHRLRRFSTNAHIFSLPYVFETMEFITSHFPGGLFINVRHVFIFDMHYPFEHDFFVMLASSFPLLTSLAVMGTRPQQKKRMERSDDTDSIDPVVKWNHLDDLSFSCVGGHMDYAEQFLVYGNTLLPRLRKLQINYEWLVMITENFTRDATRRNCSNIEHLTLDRPIVQSENMYLYFPCCK